MAKRPTRGRTKQADPVSDKEDDGSGDKLAREAWRNWKASRTHLSEWRKEAEENYDFVAGNQWTQEDLATLQEQMRVPITFNRTEPTIAAVCGYEINGRQEVTYLPREPDDTGVAETETAAARYFRQQCDAEDEESDQFNDALITGMGWTEHRMDYDENPDGMMRVERVDPLEMAYDPAAIRRNLSDRRWDIRGKWWDRDTAKDKWPDHDFNTQLAPVIDQDDRDGQPPVDRIAASFYASPGTGEYGEVRRDKVFILEYTYFEQEPFYTVLNPTSGKLEDVEPAIHSKLQKRLEELGGQRAPSVKRTRRRFKRAFVHGPDTLNKDDLEAPCPNRFHYQCITGKRDRNKNIWFGLVRAMKDPQRWANKWLSQFLHLLNTNAKTGVMYEKGAVDRPAEIENKISKPGYAIAVNPGYLDKIKTGEPSPLPQDAFNLMTYAVSSIRDATGVNLELLGQQSNDQPGVVETHRKQSAMNILAPLFNAQRQYRKEAGRLTLYFIRTYLSDGRFIRVVGQGQAKYVQLAKREDTQEYDIVVDQSPSAPNQQEATFGTIAMILPQLLKAGVPIPPSILKYVPNLPAPLAEEWMQTIQQKQSQPAPPDPKHALDAQKLQLQTQKQQQEAQESANQDKLDQQRLQIDQMKLMFDKWMEEREDARAQAQMQLEREKLASQERQHLAAAGKDIILHHKDQQHERDEGERDREHQRQVAKHRPQGAA